MKIRLIEIDTSLYLYVDDVQGIEHETIIIEPPEDGILNNSTSKERLHEYFVEHAQVKIAELRTALKNKPSKFRRPHPLSFLTEKYYKNI